MNFMRRVFGGLALVACVAASTLAAEEYAIHSFRRVPLSDTFFSEGASFADFNRDSHADVVAGPYW